MTETRFRQGFLLLLVMAISAGFAAMIRAFLLTVLLVRFWPRSSSRRGRSPPRGLSQGRRS
jgi:hypothetical protein